MSNILEVRQLSVQFDGTPILHDIHFDVPAGASVVVIGPNGAGKTVLFRALIGAIKYTGRIQWSTGVRFGYVPQKLDIARDAPITGRDFLTARAAMNRDTAATVSGVMGMVGSLSEIIDKRIGDLSGGQFQRLLVAFALLADPNVLLLDEPTAGVDNPGEERLNELLHRLQQQRELTILRISHELSMVTHATHVLCINAGQASFGPPSMLTPELLREVYGISAAMHIHDH